MTSSPRSAFSEYRRSSLKEGDFGVSLPARREWPPVLAPSTPDDVDDLGVAERGRDERPEPLTCVAFDTERLEGDGLP